MFVIFIYLFILHRRAVVVDEAHRMRNKNSALLGCLQQVRTGAVDGCRGILVCFAMRGALRGLSVRNSGHGIFVKS